ncbi:MAG: right-handed parallel beta-helix repeat-containing protein [Pseudomonadota bacterium]
MNIGRRLVHLSIVLFLVQSIGGIANSENTQKSQIAVKNVTELSTALNNAQTENSTVSTIIYVRPGIYTISDTIVINVSNITVIAEPGAKIILADHVNKPVIAIGSQEETPTFTVENIYISGIEIDGNKRNQNSEFDADKNWIRNNAIDVRRVKRLTLDNVICKNARSGGLVISWASSDIHVNNSIFGNNYFDGVAYYDSQRVYTNSCSMLNNNSAGISLDNAFSDSIFANCILDANGDVGIFMRNSSKIRFNGCTIQNSGSYAAFLGNDDNAKGVSDVLFSGCHVLDNNGGILVGSTNQQSGYISVLGSSFRGNEKNGRTTLNGPDSILKQSGNIIIK